MLTLGQLLYEVAIQHGINGEPQTETNKTFFLWQGKDKINRIVTIELVEGTGQYAGVVSFSLSAEGFAHSGHDRVYNAKKYDLHSNTTNQQIKDKLILAFVWVKSLHREHLQFHKNIY